MELIFNNSGFLSPFREMAAYEALWNREKVSFKKIAELFSRYPGSLPSELVDNEDEISRFICLIREKIVSKDGIRPNVLVNSSYDYPQRLRDAKDPVEVLYYCGNIEYLSTRGVAIVGSRKASQDGVKRAKKLAKLLIKDDFTVVSGLAEGIDTAAHTATIENNGRTIAVIGTPLNEFYPRQNKELQLLIAKKHLLISQVPYIKYANQDFRWNRGFFPERNKTMSALTMATIIVEAGETSGSLIQAKAAIEQGRKLFILQSCFENKNITWPHKYEKMGAIRVREYEDIKEHLK